MQPRKAFSRMFWGLTAGQLAAQVGSTALMVPFIVAFALDGQTDFSGIIPFAQLFTVLFIPAFFIFTRRLPRYVPERRGRMGFGELVGWLCVALTASELLGAASNYLLEGLYGLFGISDPASAVESILDSLGIWEQLALIAVLAPVVEELVFRKLMFERVRPYGDRVAVIVTAVAFGMFHGSVTQIPYATAAGLVLGYVMLRTNNIFYPMLLHFLNNLISVALTHALGFGNPRLDAIVSLVSAAYMAAGVIFFISRHRRGFGEFRELHGAPVSGRVVFGNAGGIVFIVLTCVSAVTGLIVPLLTELVSRLTDMIAV